MAPVSTLLSTQTATKTNPKRKTRIVLYDLHEVARFMHAVAYARIAAQNTHVMQGSFFNGGDQVDSGDFKKIRYDAERLSAALMTEFSHRCKTGSESSVRNFLEHQRVLYRQARLQIDAVYAQVRQSNTKLTRNLEVGTSLVHIIHGASNATFTVLSFFATGGGGGAAAAQGLNLVDGLVSQQTVIGVVKEAGKDVAEKATEKVGEKYSDKAVKTLSNLVTRDWKYEGALHNAQVRLASQGTVAVGARTLGIFFAVDSLKKNMGEMREAFEQLRHTEPAAQGRITAVPDLQMPALH